MTDHESADLNAAVMRLLKVAVREVLQEMRGPLIQHGASCTRKEAAAIIGKSPATVSHMLRDGRLRLVPGSDKVDTQSVTEYLDNAKLADFEARQRKRGRKKGMYVTPATRAIS